MWKRISILMVLVALVAGACGDDDAGSGEEQAVVDALMAKMQEDTDVGEPFDDAESSQCFATALVSEFGLTRMAELGVTADAVTESEAFFGAMSESEIGRAVDLAFGCVDIGAVFGAEFTGLSDASRECFVGGLEDSGFLRTATIAGLRGEEFEPDEAAMGQLLTAAEACLTDEEMSALFGS